MAHTKIPTIPVSSHSLYLNGVCYKSFQNTTDHHLCGACSSLSAQGQDVYGVGGAINNRDLTHFMFSFFKNQLSINLTWAGTGGQYEWKASDIRKIGLNLARSSESVQIITLAYAFTWDQNEGWEISKLPNMFSYCNWKEV